MKNLRWEPDVIYLFKEMDIFPHYLLKDPKDNIVWESYYKAPDRFQINKTNIVFKNEIDARRYCEINARTKIEEQIKYLKSLLEE